MKYRNAAFPLLAILLAVASGCKVQVNNGSSGEGKDVKISTPLGGLNVETDQVSAEDLGLPAYPGAQISNDQQDKSANIGMQFGSWQLRVKVVGYRSSDPQEKVIAFYRHALSAYGDVIECKGGQPVGTPAITGEGLSCSDSGHVRTRVPTGKDDLELKAGSKYRQHVVAFVENGGPGSEFVLIALELPHEMQGKSGETN